MTRPKVTLRQEAPPHVARGRRPPLSDRLSTELDHLRDDPGSWYRLLEYDRHASAPQAGRTLAKQCPDFEFTSRAGVVYGRYIGHGDDLPGDTE